MYVVIFVCNYVCMYVGRYICIWVCMCVSNLNTSYAMLLHILERKRCYKRYMKWWHY